jgi:DNA-binding FadR family transcriptional regulator
MKEPMKHGDLPGFVEADVDFHATLVAKNGNHMFATLRGVVELAVQVRETLFFPFGDASKHGLEIHEELVNDIAARSDTAWATARRMMSAAREEMRAELHISPDTR